APGPPQVRVRCDSDASPICQPAPARRQVAAADDARVVVPDVGGPGGAGVELVAIGGDNQRKFLRSGCDGDEAHRLRYSRQSKINSREDHMHFQRVTAFAIAVALAMPLSAFTERRTPQRTTSAQAVVDIMNIDR